MANNPLQTAHVGEEDHHRFRHGSRVPRYIAFYTHHTTIDFLKSEGITGKNEAVFRANGVSHATGYRILRSKNPRTLKK